MNFFVALGTFIKSHLISTIVVSTVIVGGVISAPYIINHFNENELIKDTNEIISDVKCDEGFYNNKGVCESTNNVFNLNDNIKVNATNYLANTFEQKIVDIYKDYDSVGIYSVVNTDGNTACRLGYCSAYGEFELPVGLISANKTIDQSVIDEVGKLPGVFAVKADSDDIEISVTMYLNDTISSIESARALIHDDNFFIEEYESGRIDYMPSEAQMNAERNELDKAFDRSIDYANNDANYAKNIEFIVLSSLSIVNPREADSYYTEIGTDRKTLLNQYNISGSSPIKIHNTTIDKYNLFEREYIPTDEFPSYTWEDKRHHLDNFKYKTLDEDICNKYNLACGRW